MGAIWFRQSELVDTVVEYVGFKSGLAVTQKQLTPYIPEWFRREWEAGPNTALRVRSEAFQELIAETLASIGVPDPGYIPFFAPLAAISRRDPQFERMFKVLKGALPRFRRRVGRTVQWDFASMESFAFSQYGATGSELAVQMATNPASLKRGPWGVFRDIVWEDIRELDELFTSENLKSFHGKYFDQRFVDYLAQNQGELGRIQWRQFEGLTAEFFERCGYSVKLGPGRDDDNIDVRVWADRNVGPPTILIQCKRERKKVGKVVVKALYADVVHEKARSGMIVTTSALAPGAAKLLKARGYPIADADRGKVLKWIKAMRSRRSGASLKRRPIQT